jgi:hypothetical protein
MFKYIRRLLGKAYEGAKSFGRRVIKNLPKAEDIRQVDTQSKQGYTPAVQAILAQCGNDIVTNIRVCRDVVSANTESLLNAVSLGKFAELKKKYGFDTFFHLYMLFDAGGKTLMIEKNQTINLSYYTKPCLESEFVSPGGTFTLNQMLDKTRESMGAEKFLTYDVFTNNCQLFLIGIMKANGLLTPKIEKFVYQNINQIVDELPGYVKPLVKGITDIARVVDTSLQKSVYKTNGNQGPQATEGAQNPANAS